MAVPHTVVEAFLAKYLRTTEVSHHAATCSQPDGYECNCILKPFLDLLADWRSIEEMENG